MQGDVVAAGIERIEGIDRLGTAGADLVRGQERIEGLDLHAEGSRFGTDQASDSAEGLDTKGLALDFRARGRRKLRTGHEDHQRNGQLGHGVGVLTRRVHRHDPLRRAGGEVEVVEAGTGAHDNLELRRGGNDLGGDLVRTDDQRIGVGDGRDQVSLVGIFLEQRELIARLLNNLANACDRCGRERLLGGNENFHKASHESFRIPA